VIPPAVIIFELELVDVERVRFIPVDPVWASLTIPRPVWESQGTPLTIRVEISPEPVS
jgi:hypothetical protein